MSLPLALKKINLRDLMKGERKVIIEHDDKPYLLSITRRGKLILTAAEMSLLPEVQTQHS